MTEAKKTDKMIVLGGTKDATLGLRIKEDRAELGVMTTRPVGEPFGDHDIIDIKPDGSGMYDVTERYVANPATSGGRTSSRPATKAYTHGWDRIFGKKDASSTLN